MGKKLQALTLVTKSIVNQKMRRLVRRMFRRSMRLLMASTLSFSMVAAQAQVVAPSVARDPQSTSLEQARKNQQLLSIMFQASAAQAYLKDPLVKEFLSQPVDLSQKLPVEMADANPFFMHGQKWSRNSEIPQTFADSFQSQDVGVRTSAARVELVFPTIKKSLSIAAPLKPLGMAGGFIFFKDASSPDAEAEGLWFVGLNDAVFRARFNAPVPVYFVPMPRLYGKIEAVGEDQLNDIAIIESRDAADFAIELSTVRFVRQWQDYVLLMAQSQCIASKECRSPYGPLGYDEATATRKMLSVLPPVGLVHGHGYIPEKAHAGIRLGGNTDYLKKLLNLIEPQAHAIELDADMIGRLIWMGQILGTLILSGAVLQNTVLREKLSRIRIWKDLEGLRVKFLDKLNAAKEAETAAKKSKDAEKIAAASHEVAKLKDSVLSLESLERSWIVATETKDKKTQQDSLAIVAKTLEDLKVEKLGVKPNSLKPLWYKGLEKVGETFDVFAHLITAVGQFGTITFSNILEYFGDKFIPQWASAENSLIRRYMKFTHLFTRSTQTSVAVNSRTFFLGSIVSGSVDTAFVGLQYVVVAPAMANWAGDHLGSYMQQKIDVAFDVNNPDAASIMVNDTIRNQLGWTQSGASGFSGEARAIELPIALRAVEAEFRAKGKDPLDPALAPKIKEAVEVKVNNAMIRLGLPDSNQFLFDMTSIYRGLYQEQGSGALEADERESSRVYMRPGLAGPTLRRAIKLAQQIANQNQDQESRDVLAALTELRDDYKFLSAVQKGRMGDQSYISSVLQRMYKARKAMALLSFEGPVDMAAKAIPDAWKGKSPEVIRKANLLWRYSLASYVDGEDAHKIYANYTATDEMTKEKSAVKEYKTDSYGRKQLERAELAGTVATQIQGLHIGTPEYEKAFLAAYHKELSNAVRLSYTSGSHVDYATREAEAAMEVAKKDPEILRLEGEGNTYARLKLLARTYSLAFFGAYKTAVIDNGELPPLHIDQPGALQYVRNFSIVKKSKALTILVRAAEASYNHLSFLELGRRSFYERTIPVWYDVWTGFVRSMRYFPDRVTAGAAMSLGFWHVNLAWSTVVIMAAVACTIITPNQYINRFMGFFGLKPMNNTVSKILWTIPYAWLTFLGMFPVLMYASDAKYWLYYAPEVASIAGGSALISLYLTQLLYDRDKKSRGNLVFDPKSSLPIGTSNLRTCPAIFSN